MRKEPLISVVMPVYNTAAFLQKSMDSVLGQTWERVELVLVDDGSTDESGAMVDACAEKNPGRVRVVHRENGGLMRAWMDGVEAATGDYVCFVDSDDWVEPEMLAALAAELACDENGEPLPGQVICCGAILDFPHRPSLEVYHGLPEGVYEGERLERELKREIVGHEQRRITSSRCMKLIPRQMVLDNMRFLDTSIRMGEDLNITVPVLLDAERVVIMYRPYYHYIYMQDSMAHRYDAGFYEDSVRLRKCLTEVSRVKGRPEEVQIRREFLFLFLLAVKSELRRNDGRGAAGRAVKRVRELCDREGAPELAGLLVEPVRDPANRLMVFLCRRPSTARIFLVRWIFRLYEMVKKG